LVRFNTVPYICNIVVKNVLRHSKTYRCSIALVLLSLYAFIAIPVQSWHMHPAKFAYTGRSKAIAVATQPTVNADFTYYARTKQEAKHPQTIYTDLLQISGDNTDDCKICSHHYSSYLESNATIILINCPVSKVLNCSFQSSFPPEEVLSFSNKGPPTTTYSI
jgi:hypothetical protein